MAIGNRVRAAREAAGLGLRETARRAYLSAGYLSQVEHELRTPSTQVLVKLGEVLGVGLVQAAGSIPSTGPVAQLLNDGDELSIEEYAEALRHAVSQLVTWDTEHGGDGVYHVGARSFAAARERVGRGNASPTVQSDLWALAGELGEVTSWAAYDADRQTLSRHLSAEALLSSRRAGDRSTELLTLGNLAMQSTWLQRDREAMRIADDVLDSYRPTGLIGALFWLRRARALAGLGDRPRALDAFARTRALFEDGPRDSDPVWAWWLDEVELAWHEGIACASLGNHKRGTALLQQALDGCPPVKRRCRLTYAVQLLDCLVRLRAWREAEHALTEITGLLGVVASARNVHHLRRIGRTIVADAAAPSSLRDAAAQLA